MKKFSNAETFHNAQREHRFFSTVSIITLMIVLVGFANVYGPRLIGSTEPAPLVIHIHAALFASWLIAFVVQTLLVLNRKIDLHKKAGQWAMVLAGAMLVSGLITSIESAQMGHLGIPGVVFPTREGFLLLNLASLSLFTGITFAGWVFRTQPQTHKRLMLMATVAGLAPPGISRLPLISGHTPAIAAITLTFIFMGPLYDWRTRGKIHNAYLYSFPFVLLILPPVITVLSATSIWLNISAHLLDIPFTQ